MLLIMPSPFFLVAKLLYDGQKERGGEKKKAKGSVNGLGCGKFTTRFFFTVQTVPNGCSAFFLLLLPLSRVIPASSSSPKMKRRARDHSQIVWVSSVVLRRGEEQDVPGSRSHFLFLLLLPSTTIARSHHAFLLLLFLQSGRGPHSQHQQDPRAALGERRQQQRTRTPARPGSARRLPPSGGGGAPDAAASQVEVPAAPARRAASHHDRGVVAPRPVPRAPGQPPPGAPPPGDGARSPDELQEGREPLLEAPGAPAQGQVPAGEAPQQGADAPDGGGHRAHHAAGGAARKTNFFLGGGIGRFLIYLIINGDFFFPQVKVWFQNRRLSDRKVREQQERQHPSSSSSSCSPSFSSACSSSSPPSLLPLS